MGIVNFREAMKNKELETKGIQEEFQENIKV
jgi:hypothetical protein